MTPKFEKGEGKEPEIIVPERWFKSLLEYANQCKELNLQEHTATMKIKHGVNLMPVFALIGYASSAESILKSNERVKQKKSLFKRLFT